MNPFEMNFHNFLKTFKGGGNNPEVMERPRRNITAFCVCLLDYSIKEKKS